MQDLSLLQPKVEEEGKEKPRRKEGITYPIYESSLALEQIVKTLPPKDLAEVRKRWVDVFWKKRFQSAQDDLNRGDYSLIAFITVKSAYEILTDFLLEEEEKREGEALPAEEAS